MTRSILSVVVVLLFNAGVWSDPPEKPLPSSQSAFMAGLVDGSSLRVAAIDDVLELATPHGTLRIPMRDVKRIEFMLRVPESIANKIELSAAELSHPEYRRRQAATNALLEHGERAIPTLQAKMKSADAEAAKRAEQILERLKSTLPAERLTTRTNDVVYTNDSKIAGRIVTISLRVRTLSFGEQSLSVADIRSLRNTEHAESVDLSVLPDPGVLAQFDGQVMKPYLFRVTGQNAGGTVWGTDTYTVDSKLSMAAVHAGILKLGQSGVVKVTLLGPQPMFMGSNRNGVTSNNYGPFNGYKVEVVGDDP